MYGVTERPRSFPSRALALAASFEALPVGNVQTPIHHPLELAAVVGVAGWRLIRQRRRLDDIPAADFDRVDADDACRLSSSRSIR